MRGDKDAEEGMDHEAEPSEDGALPENDYADHFPWVDVDRSREDWRLQKAHPREEVIAFHNLCRPCPGCGKPSPELAWFYFASRGSTWRSLCGRAGWMAVCDDCHRQVHFFLEVMS